MSECPSEDGAEDTRLDERLVKWVPIVVPLLALMLLVGAFLIEAEVL